MKYVISKQIRNKLAVAVVFSLTGIILASTGSRLNQKITSKKDVVSEKKYVKPEVTSTSENVASVIEAEIEEVKSSLPEKLDFTFIETNENLPQKMLDLLAEKDARLFSNLYYGNNSQDIKINISVSVLNGDNKLIDHNSNNKQIVSMANVFFHYNPSATEEEILNYISSLWDASHKYSIKQSDLYYCDGCNTSNGDGIETNSEDLLNDETIQNDLDHEITELSVPTNETETQTVETGPGIKIASISEAEMEETIESSECNVIDEVQPKKAPLSEGKPNCPGHKNKNIILTINNIDDNHSLFDLDKEIVNEQQSSDWEGWTEQNRNCVEKLIQQDWKETYNLDDFSSISVGTQLSASELSAYTHMISDDENPERKKIILQALQSVGRIPYYWGGKASSPGYKDNHFGEFVTKDLQGRSLKGLDCSGWVNWVYWSAFNKRLPSESTSGLTNVGKAIDKESLKPGDLLIRTGKDAHVVMFLMWADTAHNKLFCIHESSGKASNVSVSRVDANWQSYRSLFNDQ